MRIIGGSAGGRRIRAPKGLATRPTSDRVREAIFNILGAPPPSARVLDLYAGAGALGLEALSRGAEHAVLVDRAAAAARCIADNARDLGFADRARVVRADALAAVGRLVAEGLRFQWVFVDPPYAGEEARRILARLGDDPSGSPLDPDAVVIVEHDRRNAPGEACGRLERVARRRYGDTEVSFYRRAEPPAEWRGA